MLWLWWLLAIIIVIVWAFTLVDIVRRRHSRTAGKTAAWIILILILPVIGTLIYFLVNGAGAGEGAPRDPDVSRMTGERY